MSKFQKVLGKKEVVTLVLGAIIGWGWIILTGEWVLKAGALGALTALTIAGVVFTLIGLVYAELASALPFTGGEHVYSQRALGDKASFVCTWAVILAYVSVVAFQAVALPVAMEYLFPDLRYLYLWTFAGSDVYLSYVIIGVLIAFSVTVLNILGIKLSASFQNFATFFILVIGVLFILGAFFGGDVSNAQPLFNNGIAGIFPVLITVPLAMTGFDVVPQAAEEIDLPQRQIGQLLVATVLFAIAWYMLIVVGVFLSLPRTDIDPANLSIADGASLVWGNVWAGKIFIMAGVAGIITSWNSFIIGGSRAIYAMAHSNMLPAAFGKLHPKYGSPANALMLIGALTIFAPFLGKQAFLYFVNAGSFGLMIAYCFVAVSFIVLRKKEPHLERPYFVKNGLLVGYAAAIFCFLILLLFLPGSPAALQSIEWGIVVGWFVLGIVLYALSDRTAKM
ncbi:MAG: APC family permease [Chitinophagales bacterium]